MGEFARVESIDALKKFRAALCKFAETVRVSLGEAESEIQRAGFWVKQEQQGYWKRQVERRNELFMRAKGALTRKKLAKTPTGGRYSCVEEEKALAAARRQLDEAKQKQANTRRWSRLLDEESYTYMAVAQAMGVAVDAEIPNALAQLDNMIAALEEYAVSRGAREQQSVAPATEAEAGSAAEVHASMARGTPEEQAGAYERLRAQTPAQLVRDETVVRDEEHEWPGGGESGEVIQAALAELDFAARPVSGVEKVVLASGAWQRHRVFLERKEPVAGDSGWYVGVADDVAIEAFVAMEVGRLVAEWPVLAAVLELPVGYVAVLDRGALEAVVDARGARVWPRGEQPSEMA
jgi:hypothetical protein